MGVPKGEMRTAANPTSMLEAEFCDGTLQQMLLLSAIQKCQRMAINIVTVLLFLADFFFKLQAHSII